MESKGLSGSSLKLIAIVTMFIDHLAATVVLRIVQNGEAGAGIGWLDDPQTLFEIYSWMRTIGRIAFPIFGFLLVEGFVHTRDWKKYALRLGMFALVSEIPFDLALNGSILEFGYQNVFFTLFLGLLMIIGYHKIEERRDLNRLFGLFLQIAVIFAAMFLAVILRTDYSMYGIICILAIYLFRKNKIAQVVAGALAFLWWEPPAIAAFIPIWFYNGKRGLNIKYFFYLFYPAHLLLLYLVCRGLGLAPVN